jgi:hypothetical protein
VVTGLQREKGECEPSVVTRRGGLRAIDMYAYAGERGFRLFAVILLYHAWLCGLCHSGKGGGEDEYKDDYLFHGGIGMIGKDSEFWAKNSPSAEKLS